MEYYLLGMICQLYAWTQYLPLQDLSQVKLVRNSTLEKKGSTKAPPPAEKLLMNCREKESQFSLGSVHWQVDHASVDNPTLMYIWPAIIGLYELNIFSKRSACSSERDVLGENPGWWLETGWYDNDTLYI